MKRILTIILCVVPMLSFASWDKYESGKTQNRCFYDNTEHRITPGQHIFACDEGLSDAIRIRFNNNEITLSCIIIKSRFAGAGQYEVKFLDADRYPIYSIKMDRVCAGYTGRMDTTIKCNRDFFERIKYYDLIMWDS